MFPCDLFWGIENIVAFFSGNDQRETYAGKFDDAFNEIGSYKNSSVHLILFKLH